MNWKPVYKRILSAATAAVICAGMSTMVFAKNTYNDFDYITSHVKLGAPEGVTVLRPSEDLTTPLANYFITGSSDPDAKLYMSQSGGDGKEVTTRGAQGSFGVYVTLEQGENTFRFWQDGIGEARVTITRGEVTTASTTTVISRMAPEYDCATYSGSTINLSCIAPSGSKVVATVGGRRIQLQQVAATAHQGVPARFTGKTTAGNVNGTRDLGKVTYTLNGSKEFVSEGSVFLTGKGDDLLVKIKNNAASIYKDASQSAFIETAKLNGVDAVVDMQGEMYQLSTGGWIPKNSVQPVTDNLSAQNEVSGISYKLVNGGELLTIEGTTAPMFRAIQNDETLMIKLFNTEGLSDLEDNRTLKKSKVFSGLEVSEQDGTSTLTFTLSGETDLWGYDIKYGANGETMVFAKYAPSRASGSQPLGGWTIAVDAGHGGSDPGALGILQTKGAMEKDITLATAIAVQKRLESLGAQVLLLRADDSDLSMNDRMTATQDVYADFFISLHCNSIDYARDTNQVSGTEVYYFENISKHLASSLAENIADYTGRTRRGAKLSNYRVTLNSYAPSVLVEMGFLTNPKEYDSMTSRKGIFNTANAVADSILATMR